MGYLERLAEIAEEDVVGLKKAQESYGDSWKRRGGVGAFMMLARKFDRLENALRPADGVAHRCQLVQRDDIHDNVAPWDIFEAVRADTRSEGILDDIRDLRRYLLLVEAEVRDRGVNPPHRDNVRNSLPCSP